MLMNKCLNCGKCVKNKYCNISCRNKHLNGPLSAATKNAISVTLKKRSTYKTFNVKCSNCEKQFKINEKNTNIPKRKKYFCCLTCSRKFSTKNDNFKETKIVKCIHCNINVEVNKRSCEAKIKCEKCKNEKFISNCEYCKNEIRSHRKKNCCSKSCAAKLKHTKEGYSRKLGLASAAKRVKRSKNEIYFANLCKEQFKNVLTNEPIFNGWDADVILPDLKIAILWNGKWHYEQITEKHSVKQVQTRGKLKIKEIIKMNFIPYIIKDMGKFNPFFVEQEFNKFIQQYKPL